MTENPWMVLEASSFSPFPITVHEDLSSIKICPSYKSPIYCDGINIALFCNRSNDSWLYIWIICGFHSPKPEPASGKTRQSIINSFVMLVLASSLWSTIDVYPGFFQGAGFYSPQFYRQKAFHIFLKKTCIPSEHSVPNNEFIAVRGRSVFWRFPVSFALSLSLRS